MPKPVKTRKRDSMTTEYYNTEVEAQRRSDALSASGRKPISWINHENPAEGDTTTSPVNLYAVEWYEPRGGDPALAQIKPLPDLED